MRVGERGHQAELPIEFSNHAKRRFGGDLGVNPIVPPMVCSQALRPSLQSDQKRYSVGDGSLILRYSSSARICGLGRVSPGCTRFTIESERHQDAHQLALARCGRHCAGDAAGTVGELAVHEKTLGRDS